MQRPLLSVQEGSSRLSGSLSTNNIASCSSSADRGVWLPSLTRTLGWQSHSRCQHRRLRSQSTWHTCHTRHLALDSKCQSALRKAPEQHVHCGIAIVATCSWSAPNPRGRSCACDCQAQLLLLVWYLGLQNDGHNNAVDGHRLAENNAVHEQKAQIGTRAFAKPRAHHAACCRKTPT